LDWAMAGSPTPFLGSRYMKQLIWMFAILLVATPVFAQDEGGGGLPSSLFGGGDFANNRGEQPKPLDAVKKFFAQANVTISGDQEKAIKPVVEAAFKQVQDTDEKYNPPAGAAGGDRGRGQGGGDRRGGGGGRGRGGDRGFNGPANPQLTAELQK